MAESLEKKSPEGLPEGAQPKNTYKTADPRTHYVDLDGLRGIAIMMTVLNHIGAYWLKATQIHLYLPFLGVDLLEFLQMGYLAVPTFFLLSGYLLTGPRRDVGGGGITASSTMLRGASCVSYPPTTWS